MKKIYLLFVFTFFIFYLTGCMKETDLNLINESISSTNEYIKEHELPSDLFSNILESKLSNSLVYQVEGETLIYYNDKLYSYDTKNLKEIENDYQFVSNIEDAFNYEFSSLVFTKGYYESFDGGEGIYKVVKDADSNLYTIKNQDNSKCLELVSYNNTVNLYQLGFKKDDNLDKFVNDFTTNYSYQNIFIPSGEYKVSDNFDLNVSNKGYFGYDTKIYSDDSYHPTGYNNGCLFYVFNNVSNILINGFHVNVLVHQKLDDPMLGLLLLRNADNVTMNYVDFYLPEEASIYSSSGIIDLFTGWSNITVKNCNLENHSSTVAGGGIGVRDIYKQGCENALFENNYLYCNTKDEVIAIFSGADTSLYPNDNGGGYIKNVTFKNNKIVGDKPNDDIGPRVVGLTVGYQISPVYNIKYIDNEIDMYSANYLLLYGDTTGLIFENNNVKIDSSYKEKLYVLFIHNSRALEAFNISVTSNSFEFKEDGSFYTISQSDSEFEFINNKIDAGNVERLFDSRSTYEDNIINVKAIKTVYHNVKNTLNNQVNATYITVVFEFYNLNLSSDIIVSDNIKTDKVSSNFMMFNGTIHFNSYSVNFINFNFDTSEVESKYYYLAYDTTSIEDKATININKSYISIYEDEGHNYIAKNTKNAVVNFIN